MAISVYVNTEDIQYLVGVKILLMSGLRVCDQLDLALFLLSFQDILPSSLHHAIKE
jgi:hypothetical protein